MADLPPISTRDLSRMPDIGPLRRLCQSLAVLDAILSPDWSYRWYCFNAAWAPGEMMASMRTGGPDEYSILFNAVGAAMKGFVRDAATWSKAPGDGPWPGVTDRIPPDFSRFRDEPAFGMDRASFVIWRRHGEPAWSHGVTDFPPGDDPDGSSWMLAIFDGDPATYRQYALDYHERLDDPDFDVPLDVIRAVYAHEPLTQALIDELNPDVELKKLKGELNEIGYPDG